MRCFIAAWPDPPTRIALAAVSEDVRQRVAYRRATRIEDLHLTVAFIGNLSDEDAFAVADAIAKMRFRPFTWRLDTLGFFDQAGVVWVGAAREPVKPLVALADQARAVLDEFALDYDRRPLAPHVTLLRGVRSFEVERVLPIVWRIDSIALYRSAPIGEAARYARVMR
ncbi:MAG: RNA 2',3'-cyclic phosphodiesterase [Burkholderiaceae bacterium]